MATFKSYPSGASMGCPGNGGARATKRGNVNGWSTSSVRRHVRWLWSVDVPALTGEGFGVTVTVRDSPPDHGEWKQLREVFLRRLREAGFIRWHWVTEWQRRGTPHMHLAVYVPADWIRPGISPITYIMSSTVDGGALEEPGLPLLSPGRLSGPLACCQERSEGSLVLESCRRCMHAAVRDACQARRQPAADETLMIGPSYGLELHG